MARGGAVDCSNATGMAMSVGLGNRLTNELIVCGFRERRGTPAASVGAGIVGPIAVRRPVPAHRELPSAC